MAELINMDKITDDDIDDIIARAEAEAAEQAPDLQVATEEVTHNEDTDLDDVPTGEEAGETETNQGDDENPEATGEAEEATGGDELEENTRVEDSNSGLDEDGNPVKADDAKEDTKDGETDNTATEPKNDGDEADTAIVDYKKQYEELLEGNKKLQGFYDEVTSEFTANGKKMKGFTDPKKIIQSQQMAAGFSEKMSAFKPYRPFMNAIKESGMLEDKTKFDMAIDIMNGDKEAIKLLIKDKGIDILDMDMDNIAYEGKQYTKSDVSLVLDDVIESARESGVESDIKDVLGGQWSDDGSLVEILEKPEDAQALVNHMVKDADGNSVYSDVQARISEKLRTDYNGSFTSKNSLARYKEAAKELENEYNESVKQTKLESLKQAQAEQAKRVEAEKAKIEEQRKQREYEAKVKTEAKKVEEARKAASGFSKPKPAVAAKVKKFDPLKLSDSELDEFLLTLG